MSTALKMLIDALLALAAEELAKRFPGLPMAWAQQFARELIRVAVEFANDPVQREAEVRAVYAKIEALLQQEVQS